MKSSVYFALNPAFRFSLLALIICCVGCSSNRAWPPKHYTEVRAFLYNLDGGSVPCVTNGQLSPTTTDTNGVRLTDAQTARFLATITGQHPDHNLMGCYVPHHAYVFYDQRHRITGWVELCFSCSHYRTSSPNSPEWLDIYGLQDLTVELGIPVLKRDEDYLTLKNKNPR